MKILDLNVNDFGGKKYYLEEYKKKYGMTLAELKSLNENLFAQKYIFAGQQVLLK